VVGRRAAYLLEGPFDWLAAVGRGLPAFATGRLFWFTRKKFSGSYFAFTEARRL